MNIKRHLWKYFKMGDTTLRCRVLFASILHNRPTFLQVQLVGGYHLIAWLSLILDSDEEEVTGKGNCLIISWFWRCCDIG